MKKISLLLVMTIFILFTSCTSNDVAKEKANYTKDTSYTYDSNNNIVLCKELAQYGYIDYDMRVSDNLSYDKQKEKYTNRTQQINSIIKSYRVASDNKDYIITDYQEGVAIVKYKGNETNLNIPEKLDGKKVVKLGGYIKKRVLDTNTVYEFLSPIYKSNVKEVTIPKFVKEISYGFFYTNDYEECSTSCDKSKSLEKIKVVKDNELYSSKNGVLYDKSQKVLLCVPENYLTKDFSIPTGVTTIYDFFSKNTVNVEIPSTVKKITSLTNDTYMQFSNSWYCPNNIVQCNMASIKVSDDNQVYSSENGVLYNKTKSELLIYPPKKLDSHFVVPNTVEKIASNEADDFKYLISLSFGKNIKEINLYSTNSPIKVIKGYKGTVAEKYAKKNGFKFVVLD